MKNTLYFFGIGMVAVLTLSTSDGFSQGQAAQNRIPQQVVINGQMVNGAFVTTAGGQLQSYTCATPQHYATADGTSQGWACYEQTTGVWLLNALPPAQAQAAPAPQPVPQQQPVPNSNRRSTSRRHRPSSTSRRHRPSSTSRRHRPSSTSRRHRPSST